MSGYVAAIEAFLEERLDNMERALDAENEVLMLVASDPHESIYIQRIQKAKACPYGPCLRCSRLDAGQGCIL